MTVYRLFRPALMLAATVLAALDLAAVVATPHPITVAQPGGGSVTIMLRGDERSHYCTTTDGYLVVADGQGVYRYATVGADGTPVAGATAAADVELRTAAERAAVAAIDREAVMAAQMRLSAREVADWQQQQAAAAETTTAAPSRATTSSELDAHRQAMSPTTPSLGAHNLLVILVQFSDKKFTLPTSAFEGMMNKEDYSDYDCTGSVRDYFIDSSNGNYVPTFDVVGPVTVAYTSSYYAGTSGTTRSRALIKEVCSLVDPEVDFSAYDCDGDGVVDNVYLFYAGYGQADTQDTSCIWPHSSQVGGNVTHDGVRLGNYTCSNELLGGTSTLAGIGTFCHEFSHALGLPDLYETSYAHTHDPGEWSLMSGGSYNNYCRTPPLHSAYERWVLGWLAPQELTANAPTDVKLRPATTDGYDDVMLVRTTSANEFFLMENRQKKSWDRYLPGHGMLMWHIEYSATNWSNNNPNKSATRPGVDIVEASGNTTDTDTGAASFPGTQNVDSHTITTWAGASTGIALADIYESAGGNIYFSVNGGNAQPAATTALNAPEVDANSVTLTWAAAEGVEFYTLTLTDPEGNVAASERLAATTYSATLAEATTYRARLEWTVATGNRLYSERTFTTGALPISVHRVEALDPTDIAYNAATASWQPLLTAADYRVEVATWEGEAGATLTEDFADKQLHNEGWTSTAAIINNYYGEAPAAVVFNKTGLYLTTAATEQPIVAATFTTSATSVSSAAELVVEACDANGNWAEVQRIVPVVYANRANGVVTLAGDVLGDDAWALRFSISTASNWVMLDDIAITYADCYTYADCGIAPLDAGTATTLQITGLQPLTNYAYRVHAYDAAGLESIPSKWILFTTPENPNAPDPSGIDDIAGDDGSDDGGDGAPWFTTTGLRLDGRPTAPGLYIHRHRVVAIP